MDEANKTEEKSDGDLPDGVTCINPEFYVVVLDNPIPYGSITIDTLELKGPYTMAHIAAAEAKTRKDSVSTYASSMAMAAVWCRHPEVVIGKLRPNDFNKVDECMARMIRASGKSEKSPVGKTS